MSSQTAFEVTEDGLPILAPLDDLDYFDRQTVSCERPLSAIEAWNAMTARPLPLLKTAFRIRDWISRAFGVAAIGGFTHRPVAEVTNGQKLDFFDVEMVSENLLVLSAHDKHLSVLVVLFTKDHDVTILASVLTNNLFGRCYMLPVGPAHKLIVRLLLERLRFVG